MQRSRHARSPGASREVTKLPPSSAEAVTESSRPWTTTTRRAFARTWTKPASVPRTRAGCSVRPSSTERRCTASLRSSRHVQWTAPADTATPGRSGDTSLERLTRAWHGHVAPPSREPAVRIVVPVAPYWRQAT
jgi:hypothetical protein